MTPGAVVRIFAPSVGYQKYHLCLCLPTDEGAAAKFLFINSDPNFEDTYAVPCADLPDIPASETGFSCFSFSMVPRFTQKQLEIYKASEVAMIPLELALSLREFANTVKSLDAPTLAFVKSSLDEIIGILAR